MIGFIVGILLFFAAVTGFGVAVYFSARKRKNKTYSLIGGIVGCLIAAVPATIYLSWTDKKNADKLNDSLRQYNNLGDE